MLTGVLVTLGVLGAIAVLVVLFLQRGREGLDLSLRGLLRVYLYLASLAGVIVFTIGVAGVLAFVLAAAFGREIIYGGPPPQPVPAIAPACPPNQPNCVTPPPFAPRPDERERRQQEDLVRGVTFLIFGTIFWGAHWTARRGVIGADERASGLYRAYLMLGTAIFAAPPNTFRQGAGEALSGGLAALPLWLAYLWLVQRAIRTPTSSSTAV